MGRVPRNPTTASAWVTRAWPYKAHGQKHSRAPGTQSNWLSSVLPLLNAITAPLPNPLLALIGKPLLALAGNPGGMGLHPPLAMDLALGLAVGRRQHLIPLLPSEAAANHMQGAHPDPLDMALPQD